jgi:fatty acid desaturase
MAKRNITKGQTTQWPKEKEQKDKQPKGCPFVIFLLAIVFFVLLLFFFWPLCCLSFCYISFGHCVE